jgi:hypothetical protein
MSRSHTRPGRKHTRTRREFLLESAGALACAVLTIEAAEGGSRPIQWDDLAPVRDRVNDPALTPATFPGYLAALHQAHLRRVRDGDFDHLVFYALQSTHFTGQPPIEPALSARALVDGLPSSERDAFLEGSNADVSKVPADARRRFADFMRVLDSSTRDVRLVYFRDLLKTVAPDRTQRNTVLLREYLRAMRFVYEKEFVAQRSADASSAVAALYRTRGLSTDTAVEAGYLVSVGLGILKALEPTRRIRRVLIVGPGLDLAPRTGLVEAGPPESYQPWAVIDALITLGLASTGDLDVVGADINPRVVAHLRRSHDTPPSLALVSGLAESETVTFSREFREYFGTLGRTVATDSRATDSHGSTRIRGYGTSRDREGHLSKTVTVSRTAARTLSAETLDVVTERLTGPPFDLVVATNILPYFDDRELTLALTNVAGMLAPGGAFVHNETRPQMNSLTAALGVPFEQSRQAVIATVRGARGPLVDNVFLHRKNAV